MLIAELITIAASSLLLINEFRNISKNKILENFVNETHVIRDRLDAIEETLLKLLDR